MFLYLVLGFLSMWMIYHTMKEEQRIGRTVSWNNKYLIIVSFIWTFIATFRLVNLYGVGGMDTMNYIMFFKNSNNQIYSGWMLHAGDNFLFKWINKTIRYMTSSYHVYFAIVYGFMAWAYLWFAAKFTPIKNNIIPYFLCFFLFWRSFLSLRSNLAIAFIMVGCVLMLENKWRYVYLFAFMSGLIHKAALPFVLVFPFVQVFNKYKPNKWQILALIVVSSIVGVTFQSLFIDYSVTNDETHYSSYARSASMGGGFWANSWKIAFEQIVLGVLMFFNENKINELKLTSDVSTCNRINIVWLICVFDMILIPMNHFFNIWRGYEFFYIPRIVMWGIILQLFFRKCHNVKGLIKFIIFLIFVAWFCFRVESMYEDSGLMPYIFDL